MKRLVLSLIVVLSFAVNAHAHSPTKVDTNHMPEPLPESPGQLIYEEMQCAMCHGHQGAGDGFMAEGLNPRPRNFTDMKVMSRINDMSMYHAIKNGISGSAMPAWSLTDPQILDVISYIKTFLADSQLTISVCMNEHRKVSLASLNLGDHYEVDVDKQELLKVSSDDNTILIEPRDRQVRKFFNQTNRRIVRTHVMVGNQQEKGHTALIAVRINDCMKFD